MTALLETDDITKSFAGIIALDTVSVKVDEGERVGLIGPNGAGKTTFFNCLLGILTPDDGTVHFGGRDISGLSVNRRARAGIGRTFQRIELFADTSVREHLLIAERIHNGTGAFWKDLLGLGRPKPFEIARCNEVLELLGLADVGDKPIEALSLGQGRLVEVGRALMTDPKLLLLDEPSSGARPGGDRRPRHDPPGDPDREGLRDPAGGARRRARRRLHRAHLRARLRHTHRGRHHCRHARRPRGPPGLPRKPGARVMTADPAPVLELEELEASYGPFRALFGISLQVGPGEAVALLGANGAGKTTVARVASGLVAPTAGAVRIDGADMSEAPTFAFARAGVAHAPEGRSVFATFTVQENLELSFRRRFGRSGVAAGLDRAFDLFPRLGERRNQVAGTLSGGEQRMLSLSRVLVEEPTLLIADELSLGLAPIIVDEVYATLATIRESGTALLIVEQHVQHALELCDRVALLDHGLVEWQGPAADAAEVVVARLFETSGEH